MSAQGSGGGSLLLQSHLVKESGTHGHSPVSGVQAKVAAQKRTATLVLGNFLNCLSFQEASSHTKRTESRTEQHYGGTTVWNARRSAAWAKEYPAGKAMP